MKKKDKKIVAAVKARAKAKAEARNKGGAIVRDLAKPDGAYTKLIICVDCGAERKVKPQDAWQVKRCVDCQSKKSGTKFKAMIARKSSPEGKHEDRVKRMHAKLDSWVKRNDEMIADGFARRKAYRERTEKEPKPRRIWP